jgi:hypothetical protein
MNGRVCIRHDDKTASWLATEGDDGRFDFYVADVERLPAKLVAAIIAEAAAIPK